MRSLSVESNPQPDSGPAGPTGCSLGPSGVQAPPTNLEKRPLRLVRHSLERFSRVIELELENATRHEAVLSSLLDGAASSFQDRSRQAAALRRELAGASSCLQRLRDHLRHLEKLRRVVVVSDLAKFDEAVAEHEALARERLAHFGALCERSRAARFVLSRDASPTVDASPPNPPLLQAQELKTKAEECEDEDDDDSMLEAWDQLADDLETLEQLMADLGQAVHEQGTQVDSIAANMESGRANMLSSVRHLATASKLKYAMAPLAGAAVGSLVAGPVGFFVGAKMGAAAGLVGGGMVGLAGGGLAKKLHKKRTDADMIELEARLEASGEPEAGDGQEPEKVEGEERQRP